MKDNRILKQFIYKTKTKIKRKKHLNPRVKVVKTLLTLFKKDFINILGKPHPPAIRYMIMSLYYQHLRTNNIFSTVLISFLRCSTTVEFLPDRYCFKYIINVFLHVFSLLYDTVLTSAA